MTGTKPVKHATKQRARAVLLRECGLSLVSISNELSVSVRTLSRWFKTAGVTKGSDSKLIEETKNELVRQVLDSPSIRARIASLIADDFALVQAVRDKLSLTLDHIDPTDLPSAAIASRALAACGTTIKTTSDCLRAHLTPDREGVMESDLPVLTVERLSDEAVQQIREVQAASADSLDVVD